MPKLRCNLCQDIISSVHVHDFETCKCGKCSIDGGDDYVKVCYHNQTDFEILPKSKPFKSGDKVKCINHWVGGNKGPSYGQICTVVGISAKGRVAIKESSNVFHQDVFHACSELPQTIST